MLVTVDEDSATPIYAQIVTQIRHGVARGAIKEGDRLPAARELAEQIGVNMHTVLKAYGELRDAGLLQLRRGRGATIRHGSKMKASQVHRMAGRLVTEAKRQGVSKEELMGLIERM